MISGQNNKKKNVKKEVTLTINCTYDDCNNKAIKFSVNKKLCRHHICNKHTADENKFCKVCLLEQIKVKSSERWLTDSSINKYNNNIYKQTNTKPEVTKNNKSISNVIHDEYKFPRFCTKNILSVQESKGKGRIKLIHAYKPSITMGENNTFVLDFLTE